MIELYYISLLTLLSTLIYISFIDMRERVVRFFYWYPIIICGSISTIVFLYYNYQFFDLMTNVILVTTVIVFFLCGRLRMIGGADAWALIFITIFSITIPFNSILDNIYTGIGVTTFINALILSAVIYPFYNYFTNIYNGVGKSAPLYYMFFAQKLNTDNIINKFVYIIPDNNYLNFNEFISYYKSSNKLLYTKDIKKDPIKYTNELLSLKERGMVWAFNAVPFIVYITFGFIVAIIIGDLYNAIVGLVI